MYYGKLCLRQHFLVILPWSSQWLNLGWLFAPLAEYLQGLFSLPGKGLCEPLAKYFRLHVTFSSVHCSNELHKRPVNEEVCNASRYECSIRHIANQKEKGVKCHVNFDFPRGWVQKNSDDTENFRLRSGYIFILKHNFGIQKCGQTETINHTLLHMRNQSMLQHTEKMSRWTNKINFNSTPTTSWKKPSAPGQK